VILHSLLLSRQVCLGEKVRPGSGSICDGPKPAKVVMLTLYPKNVAENIPAHVLRQIKDEVDE
jgi:hypothetical protein